MSDPVYIKYNPVSHNLVIMTATQESIATLCLMWLSNQDLLLSDNLISRSYLECLFYQYLLDKTVSGRLAQKTEGSLNACSLSWEGLQQDII